MSPRREAWILLAQEDPLAEVVHRLLEPATEVVAAARGWPGRDEGSEPAAIVCRHPAPEPLAALKRRLGGPVVVVPSPPSADHREARAAFAQGADVVLIDEDVEAKLLLALRAALGGLVVLSSALGPVIERPPLTPREKQVLALVVMNFSNREIADQLVLSESTVKSHLFSAFRRLGVRTRSEAVAMITDPSRGYGSGILTIPQG